MLLERQSSGTVGAAGVARRPGLLPPFVLLVIATGAGLGEWLLRIPNPTAAVVALLVLLTHCTGMALSVYRGLRPLLCLLSVFNFCWLGVASVYQLAHGSAAWGDEAVLGDDPLVLEALTLNLAASAAFLAVYALGQRGRVERPSRTIGLGAASDARRRRAAAVLIGVATVLLPYVALKSGGLGTLFSSRNELNYSLSVTGVLQGGGPGVALVKIVPGVAALVGCLLLLSTRQPTSTSATAAAARGHRALLLWGLVLVVCYANPLAYTRYIALASFGSLLLYVLRPRSRAAGWSLLGVALVVLLVAYPLGNVFRYGTAAGEAGQPGANVLASKDFDGFQQVISTRILVRDEGHSTGRYTSSAALVFVPRAVWEEKARPASIVVAEHRSYAFTNLSLPVHAELYLDFGLPGMVLVMGAWGAVWSRLDSGWAAASALSPLIAYLAVAQIGLIRGPLGSQAPIYGLATVLLLWGLRGPRTRRGPVRPPVTRA